MKIALFGATGAVGGHFLSKALGTGHDVTALVRSPVKLAERKGLTVIQGEVSDAGDVYAVVSAAEVVVSCLGNVKGVCIMEAAANTILAAAAKCPKPPKCLFVSSIGCGGSSWLIKQVLSVLAGRESFADYDRADTRIAQEARVPYVLVRPYALQEKPGAGRYRTFRGDGTFARPIAKEDVAQFLLDALTSDEWDGNSGIQLAGCK